MKTKTAKAQRKMVTVSLSPSGSSAWGALARKANRSRGALVDFLVLAPEAEVARQALVNSMSGPGIHS